MMIFCFSNINLILIFLLGLLGSDFKFSLITSLARYHSESLCAEQSLRNDSLVMPLSQIESATACEIKVRFLMSASGCAPITPLVRFVMRIQLITL